MQIQLWAVLVATIAAFAFSAVYYGSLGTALAGLHPAYAEPAPPSPLVVVVELARTLAVVVAVAVLVELTDTTGAGEGLGLAVLLWAGFPLVILAGSVLHERVPARLAAIHAGDWLVKLLLVAVVLAAWR